MPNESTTHVAKVDAPCAGINKLDITPDQLQRALTQAFNNLPAGMEVASEAQDMIIRRTMLNAAVSHEHNNNKADTDFRVAAEQARRR